MRSKFRIFSVNMKSFIAFSLLFAAAYCESVEKVHCGKGEVWTGGCVPPCPETCPPYIVRPCPKMCRLGGCTCKSGYVRDQYKNNTCVPRDKCTKHVSTTAPAQKCTEDEQWSNCALLPIRCQGSCPNPPSIGMMCSQLCHEACVCKPGYVRDPKKQYKCVKEKQC